MTTTLTSLTGKVHHAPGMTITDGTLCNGMGAARGQVRWYVRKGAVTCKSCLKAIAKAEQEAHDHDEAMFGGATVTPRDTPPARPQRTKAGGIKAVPATPTRRVRDLDASDVEAEAETARAAETAAKPAKVELEDDGTFPVITPVGSTTTHAGRYEGHFTVPVCTGKRLADAGYGLSSGTNANDVSCKRCQPLVPPAPQRATRRPQIDHKRCEHPATPRARRQCRTAQRALES